MTCHKGHKILDSYKPKTQFALQSDLKVLISNEESVEQSLTNEDVEGLENFQEQEFLQPEEMQFNFNKMAEYISSGNYYENLDMSPIKPGKNIWSTEETLQTTTDYIENTVANHESELETYSKAEQKWYSRMINSAYENLENEGVYRPQEDSVAGLITYQDSEDNSAEIAELSSNVNSETYSEENEETNIESSSYSANTTSSTNSSYN